MKFKILLIAIIAIFSTNVNIFANISRQQAENIAIENLGAGEVTEFRNNRINGRPINNITVTYRGNDFRVWVDTDGNIIRGAVNITIPEIYTIIENEVTLNSNFVLEQIRFSVFEEKDVYNVTLVNNSRSTRVLIDVQTGQILRIRNSR
ncbi:MAG: PepSY domain-containing protein [Defluviitaleaceae bacterium]|nr:PepSY domain-containing protein [Defluviitaleaceae bacterium]